MESQTLLRLKKNPNLLLPHTPHLPTFTSTAAVKINRLLRGETKNILSVLFRKIYNTNYVYIHPNKPSV
jgi:hypothetical protein